MAPGTRSYSKRPPARSVVPSQEDDRPASSGTTVPDELLHVNAGNGYVAPKTERQSPARTDISRLSQDFEALNPSLDHDQASESTVADEAMPLAEHMNEVISVISKLEGLGLQRFQIPLPKCVVLGEQSTGKSSVIEAISGIRTPRATDTCTRCPLFIKMEPTEPHQHWRAKVELRQTYLYDGRSRKKFPGWYPNPNPNDILFDTTTSMSALEELIARAQLAILTPMKDPSQFLPPLPLPDDQLQIEFSPNVVCIHVSGPGLPALSFYDLPGIIGQAESQDKEYLPKFVSDLVKDYIKDPETLILVTCSLEVDLNNSTAAGIARELKVTDRCIGVLTKPDRLPAGSRADKLQPVLAGTRFELGRGYFVVKNPGQDDIDRGMTHRDARLQEREYFEQVAPWATTLQHYHGRFGTKALQQCLSETLAAQMSKSLPVIRAHAGTRLSQIDAELRSLPEPPTHNAARIISEMLFNFSEHVQRELAAEYPCVDWRNSWEELHRKFYQELLSMKPKMVTVGDLDKGIFDATAPGRSVQDALVIDSDDDMPMSEGEETPSKKRKFGSPTSSMPPPPSRHPTPAWATLAPSRQTPIRRPNLRPVQELPEIDRLGAFRERFDLDMLAAYLEKKSKSRVPGHLNSKVVDELMMGTIADWDRPMQRFFDGLKDRLTKTMRAIFKEHFGPWSSSALYNEAWCIVEQTLKTNLHHQEDLAAADSLNDEREGPHVFDEIAFTNEEATMLERYRQARYCKRVRLYEKEMLAQTGKELTDNERARLAKDATRQNLFHKEPYKNEIEVVARVTSYYLLAARRFYESICIRIESKFFKQLKTTLRDDLDSELGIHDNENGTQTAIHLLAEPAQRLEKRQHLTAMKNTLLQGLEMLQGLESKYGDAPVRSVSQAANDMGLNGRAHSSFGPTSTPLTDEMEDITRSGLARR